MKDLSERPLNAIHEVHNGRVYLLMMKLRNRRKGEIHALDYIIGSRNYCAHAMNRVAGKNPKTTTDQ